MTDAADPTVPEPVPRQGGLLLDRLERWGLPVLIFVGLVAIWQAGVIHAALNLRDFQLPDFLTLANGACGMGAIFCALNYSREPAALDVYVAGGLLMLALFFDALDGRVARWRSISSPLGRELDSLADVISFGAAPACLAWALGCDGWWDQLVLVYFVCCGISRLARYNVTAAALTGPSEKVKFYEGTPIPTSMVPLGVVLAVAARGELAAVSLGGLTLHPIALVFFLSGCLMISKTIRIPKP